MSRIFTALLSRRCFLSFRYVKPETKKFLSAHQHSAKSRMES